MSSSSPLLPRDVAIMSPPDWSNACLAQNRDITSSREAESNLSDISQVSIISEVEPEADSGDAQVVKPKSHYERMPLEVKEMIIKYCLSSGWGVETRALPACVRGLRGTAQEVFFSTCTFDLRGMHRRELAKIPEHVFEQIQYMVIR